MAEITSERQPQTVLVVIGADPLSSEALVEIPPATTIIAADSGTDVALAAGIEPDLVVGDLDSISPAGRRWAATHARIEEYPADKDSTDTQLALAAAADLTPDRLDVLSGGGDRLDHVIAVLGALASGELTSIPTIDAVIADHHIRVLHGPGRTRLLVRPGSTLSTISLVGTATGVHLSGTRWDLAGVDLEPLSGRGVSNVTGADSVDVAVTTGVLAIFHEPKTMEPS
ncbi:MAG: thiamine diphosphokinase [Ilumatobacteraceae bacterium]